MKNTLGRVANPSFFLASTTAIVQENDPPGTEQTHAIAVNQQLRHHPRVVRRLATLLTAVHLERSN
jgi:hypothetical protein